MNFSTEKSKKLMSLNVSSKEVNKLLMIWISES